ncbi:hypothetical protein TNCV_4399431, partial [Trichonephila clavipes]
NGMGWDEIRKEFPVLFKTCRIGYTHDSSAPVKSNNGSVVSNYGPFPVEICCLQEKSFSVPD